MAAVATGQVLFTYFHFAASRELTEAMLRTGATCVAYETLRDANGRLPLLTPMSEVAGRMSIQEGAKYLERPQMGRGILLGRRARRGPAHITILGGGVVGANAAKIAAGFRADVAILDIDMDRLRYLDDIMPPNVNVLYSDRHTIRDQLRKADLVDRLRAHPRRKAPRLIEREDLRLMKPGAVIIDVAIDQGGCVATSRPTTHSEPDVHRRRRSCTTASRTCPGRSAGPAPLRCATSRCRGPFRSRPCGIEAAARRLPPVAAAVNIYRGEITNRAVAETLLPAVRLPLHDPLKQT